MRRPLPRSKNHRGVCLTRSTHSTQSSEGGLSEEEGRDGPSSVRHGYYASRGTSLDGISRYASRLMVSLCTGYELKHRGTFFSLTTPLD